MNLDRRRISQHACQQHHRRPRNQTVPRVCPQTFGTRRRSLARSCCHSERCAVSPLPLLTWHFSRLLVIPRELLRCETTCVPFYSSAASLGHEHDETDRLLAATICTPRLSKPSSFHLGLPVATGEAPVHLSYSRVTKTVAHRLWLLRTCLLL